MELNSYKKLIKVAGIINIIFGSIVFCFQWPRIYSFAVIITGIIVYSMSCEKEELFDKRGLLTGFAIAFIFLNFVSSIIVFFALGKMRKYEIKVHSKNAPPNAKLIIKKKNVDQDIKKIDILLKLGVVMVFIAGLLFATTSWDFVSNPIKALVLLLLALLFLGLSFFSEKKLNLYTTTFMYWVLSMGFFLLTIVGMLYFGLGSSSLTYIGSNSSLAYAITFFTTCGLSIATYLKFSQKAFLFFGYSSVLLVLIYTLYYLGINETSILYVISIIILIINYFSKKDDNLFYFSRVVSYILPIFLLNHIEQANGIITLLTCLFDIINLSYLTYIEEKQQKTLLNIVLSYLLVPVSISGFNLSPLMGATIVFVVSMIYTVIIKYRVIKVDKRYGITNYILFTIVFVIAQLAAENNIFGIIVTSLYLIINLLEYKSDKDEETIPNAVYIEPFALFILIANIINKFVLSITNAFATIVLFSSIVYCILHLLSKENKRAMLYKIAIYVSSILFLVSTVEIYDKVTILFSIIPCIYLLYSSFKNQDENNLFKSASYILTLYSLFNILCIKDIYNMNQILAPSLIIAILVGTILISKNSLIKKIASFMIVVPLYHIFDTENISDEIKIIVESIMVLYITFLIIKFICKNKTSKNIIGIIGIVLSVLIVLELETVASGIYIGIIGIIIIMIGYYDKELNTFFLTGIIITIINIIYQLKDFWEVIPFWLYLLIGGLGIIFFVTFKEVKKIKEK